MKIWTQCQITLIFCGPSLQFVVIKSAREHWKVPVNIRKLISKFIKICPWTSKSAREHLRYFCPWTPQKCPWKRPKKCPWTHSVAREHSQKVPVNAKKCPWNLLKKWRSQALSMFTGEKTLNFMGLPKKLQFWETLWKIEKNIGYNISWYLILVNRLMLKL